MTDSVRIGVAGAGVFGAYHAAKFTAHPDAVVAGVFDIDAARANDLASRCGAEAFRNYRKFLANVDAVIVAAPATRHFALAEEALNCGRHLLVEKPLALSVDQADALVGAAKARGLVLQVGHQERYVCAAAGLFSKTKAPTRIESVRLVPKTGRCEDVSVVFDLMVHDIDIIQQLTKSTLCSISAEGDEHEITAEAVLDSGVVVFMRAGRGAYAPERRMTITSDEGVVEFDFIDRRLKRQNGINETVECETDDAPLALHDPLAHGAALFVGAIRGQAQGYVTGADGRACVDWALRIEEAAGLAMPPVVEIRERMRA